MEIVILIIGGFLIFFFFIAPRMGNIDFWKFVANRPQEGWEFFNNHPDWFVGSPPPTAGYCGPYKVLNPQTGAFVSVYCTNTEIAAASQNEFMVRYK